MNIVVPVVVKYSKLIVHVRMYPRSMIYACIINCGLPILFHLASLNLVFNLYLYTCTLLCGWCDEIHSTSSFNLALAISRTSGSAHMRA